VCALATQNVYGGDRLDMSKQKVIAERQNKAGVRVMLAVDIDDVVHEINIGTPGTSRGTVVAANLGTRISSSGKLTLAAVLPSNKIPTLARRVTLRDGTVVHVVMTWGFSQYPDILEPHAHLYVIRVQHNDVTQVFDEELGSELQQFLVEDINHDGQVEILAATNENAMTSLYVWQIQPEGEVREIQKIEGYSVHTNADRFLDQPAEVLVEGKIDCSIEGAVCLKIDSYQWSTKKKQFAR
jgi:hypothetical protein